MLPLSLRFFADGGDLTPLWAMLVVSFKTRFLSSCTVLPGMLKVVLSLLSERRSRRGLEEHMRVAPRSRETYVTGEILADISYPIGILASNRSSLHCH